MPAHRLRLLLLAAAVLTAGCEATTRSSVPAQRAAPVENAQQNCPSCGGPIERVPNMTGPLPATSYAQHRAGKAIAVGTCVSPPTSPVCRACRLYEVQPGAAWTALPADFGTE